MLISGILILAVPAFAGSAAHEAGRKIYNFRCYYCHGYSGDARTLAASFLDPKPRDFTHTPMAKLSRAAMIEVVTQGSPGTAMASFKNVLSRRQIELVVDFVRKEFMRDKACNTHYHTPENGWPDHDRYKAAFPFARGEITLDKPLELLTPMQREGRRLYLSACVSCHDRGRVSDEGAVWDPRPVSYPRIGYSHQNPPRVDAMTSATPYSRHDVAPRIPRLTRQEARGERIYQANCAFCHAADGTGRNWIGSFMEPHARDLTGEAMAGMTRPRLRKVIQDGLPGTSMPAWRSVLSDEDIDALIAYISRAFYPIPMESTAGAR